MVDITEKEVGQGRGQDKITKVGVHQRSDNEPSKQREELISKLLGLLAELDSEELNEIEKQVGLRFSVSESGRRF